MVPTSLPELPKPSRTSGKSQKTYYLEPEFVYKKMIIQKHEKHMKIQRNSRIPGSEPVLLDLQKLFLLSDSMESSDKTKCFGKNEFLKRLKTISLFPY